MCIVAVAHRASSRYPLILAANRDERHARPSAAADWWHGPGSLLGGRDLEAGGSWLGVTGAGRFAAVTNIFDGASRSAASRVAASRTAAHGSDTRRAAERSRGALVAGFLEGTAAPADFAAVVAQDGDRYGPFNLVVGDGDALSFVSNRNTSSALGPGIHVFSNNSPGLQWSKVGRLGDAIALAADRDDTTEYLIETLSGAAARGGLERAADSLFVVGADFGTRCTTVLTVDAGGRAVFVEQRFGPGGASAGRSAFTFEAAP